jgi:hypothetical protein
VRAVSFSSGGLLLAVAYSDNELYIYDSWFMGGGKKPMERFLHWKENCSLDGDVWGIVDAVWIDRWCGRKLGVVIGGSDGKHFHHILIAHSSYIYIHAKGCVSFWDVCRSADDILNGKVLAQPNSDIGHFSVGNPYNGEKPLTSAK